ncbi:MAG: CBS domain-containing protein [Candidatus Eremiobacterota bacterium]
MTKDVITVHAGTDLAKIMDLMDTNSIRHVPVVDDEGNLVGIISQTDILATLQGGDVLPLSDQREMMRGITAGEIMRTGAFTADPDDELADAGRTMLENKISCLPITEGSRLIGILTASDFVRYVAMQEEAAK